MNKVNIKFSIFSADRSELCTKEIDFSGSYEEAKRFVENVIDSRVEVQNTEANSQLPY